MPISWFTQLEQHIEYYIRWAPIISTYNDQNYYDVVINDHMSRIPRKCVEKKYGHDNRIQIQQNRN